MIKKIKILNGKPYSYRYSDKLKFARKFSLGDDDAIEKAINKELCRIKRRKK